MGKLENLESGDKLLYSEGFFSGDYNQDLYLKKANDDGSNRPKYYISVHSIIDGKLVQQGYIYFFLDYEAKTSHFIGVKVDEQFRNLNIGSFLVASWIDLCLNNGYDFLGVNPKQRKPFLLYLLKTYGFEIMDKSLYLTRPDVISIYRSSDFTNKNKYLLFKDKKHEKTFEGTNIFRADNYSIIHHPTDMIHLDDVILPLQNMKRNAVDYELLDQELAEAKVEDVLSKHKR
ncbi:MAG: hypothetical protein E7167_02780 [Firmicutes bacterium]|nr:hypothetical protein [Bacillota bacterium]